MQIRPHYPAPPTGPGQWTPAGPTPDLAAKLGDVDGTGVTIGIIDLYNERTGEVMPHALGVESTAQAVAPGAHTRLYSVVEGGNVFTDIRKDGSDPSDPQLPHDLPLDQALLQSKPDFFLAVNERLNALADDPQRDPNMRVINMSLGGSRNDYYEVVWSELNQKAEDGSWTHPELRETVLGKEPLAPLEDLRQIAAYADARLDNPESAYSQALADYQETTARLAADGIQLVVAAGNKGPGPAGRAPWLQRRGQWDEVHPGSNISDMTRSPDVIAVANYDMNTGLLHSTSGRGDGHENGPGHPTMLTAPGNGTLYPQNPSTSAATPYVSGTIALMLQANPSLEPGEIREILQDSSHPLPGVSPRAQGAGLLDAEAAVRAAQTE